MVGLGWWFGILGVLLSNTPFHKGIPNTQTTNPNHQQTKQFQGCWQVGTKFEV